MKKFIFAVMLVLLLAPAGAMAAEFRGAASGKAEVTKTETARNLYIAGQSVAVNGNTSKDLYAAGSSVDINGDVENSLVAVGSTINVNGTIGDNAKAAGSTVVVNGRVGGDLMLAGSDVKFTKEAVVSGDLLMAGATIDLAGTVSGNVKLTGANVTISGKVSGDVDVSQVQSLTVTGDAVIGGHMNYTSSSEASVDANAKIVGGVNFTQATEQSNTAISAGVGFMAILFKMAGLFVFLLILIYLLPKFCKKLLVANSDNFWGNLGRGFATLILAPAIMIALWVMTVTIGVGFLVLFLYISALILTTAVVGLNVGAWFQKSLLKDSNVQLDWKTALIGAIFVGAIGLIPFVGPLAIFLLFLAGLGSLIRLGGDAIIANRK